MESVARLAIVRGTVQGVAFRHYTKVEARALGLSGYVRNLPDGAVEVWCEGAPERVDALLAWLRRGPPAARVQDVDVRDVACEGLARFEVRFDR